MFSVLSIGLLLYFILVPESPRWDLNNHKIERAKKTFLHIAQRNGIDVKQTNFEKYFSLLRDRLEKEKTQKRKYVILICSTFFVPLIGLLRSPYIFFARVKDRFDDYKTIGKEREFLKRLFLLMPVWFLIGMR